MTVPYQHCHYYCAPQASPQRQSRAANDRHQINPTGRLDHWGAAQGPYPERGLCVCVRPVRLAPPLLFRLAPSLPFLLDSPVLSLLSCYNQLTPQSLLHPLPSRWFKLSLPLPLIQGNPIPVHSLHNTHPGAPNPPLSCPVIVRQSIPVDRRLSLPKSTGWYHISTLSLCLMVLEALRPSALCSG